jgi:hypothetical protein
MSCERFRTRLVDFALGAEDVEFGAHLDACASCRAELDAQRSLLASIDRGLASMVAGEPAGDFAAHVRRRIAENASAPHPWFAGWLPVTVAALALIVLVSFWMIRRPDAPPERAKETPPAQTARPPREPQSAQVTPAVPAPSNAGGPRTIRPPRPPQSAANREPEVLVPRSEMEAFLRFYQPVRDGQADASSLMARATLASEPIRPLTTTALEISLLEIEPLTEEGRQKGSSERR